MTEKTPGPDHVAVAVASIETGFQKLGETLAETCKSLGLAAHAPVRLLGNDQRFAAVELDLGLGQTGLREARQKLMQAFAGKADIALTERENRRKKLLISDMDSTIIQQECLDELAAYAGLKDEISEITKRAMAGELNFEEALEARVSQLKGLELSALKACFDERISLMPGALTLVATMRANGAHCLLVSGGFTYFTSRVAAWAGFHDHQGNTLIDDGIALTGKVGYPILGREAKQDALEKAAIHQGFSPAQAIAMGDGANDLAMIETAGLGLAVHAKPIVTEAADAAISVTDLTTALYFQGYSDSEIVWRD